MPDELGGNDDLNQPPSFFPSEGGPERTPENLGPLVEVRVQGVYQAENNGNVSRFVLLSDGPRRLPIVIGAFEAHAIQASIEGVHPDRPMTHDLCRNILDRLETRVEKVAIDDLWNTIYYAKISLKQGSESMEIDARPSDAIALAVRFGAPIFVADAILDQDLEI